MLNRGTRNFLPNLRRLRTLSTETTKLLLPAGNNSNMALSMIPEMCHEPGFKIYSTGRRDPRYHYQGVDYSNSAEELRQKLAGEKLDVMVPFFKPKDARETSHYADLIKPDGLLISIAAGVPIQVFEGYTGIKTVRAMPTLPAAIKQSTTAAFGVDLSDKEKKLVAQILGTIGSLFWVDSEKKIDAFTATIGSGPGYFYKLAEYYSQAMMSVGFNAAEAESMTKGMFRGSANMLYNDTRTAEELRRAVTSKGGTTEAGLTQLTEQDILANILSRTFKVSNHRAVELAAVAITEMRKTETKIPVTSATKATNMTLLPPYLGK